MRPEDMDESTLRRLKKQWLDPEVDTRAIKGQFSLSDDHIVQIRIHFFGPRPAPGAMPEYGTMRRGR